MDDMTYCAVDHCYRETNFLADELAKLDTRERVVEIDGLYFLANVLK